MNNSVYNLVCLCRTCHMKTNGNREYWTWQLQLFMNLFKGATYQLNYLKGGY
jgi:hypothetical protein